MGEVGVTPEGSRPLRLDPGVGQGCQRFLGLGLDRGSPEEGIP